MTLARWLFPLLLIVAGIASYHNSFDGAFLFDDARTIQSNTAIRQLWPLWNAMLSPPGSGLTNRPIVTLSLAISYAFGGLDVRSFHILNLAIHVLAGLLLYGIVRRMLESDKLRFRCGRAAPWLALAVAGIWIVHTLQTQSVTYITQRCESLMGLFFLLTLYCGIRGLQSPRPGAWRVAAVIACALGMGSKEVMVSAPVVMLLYDRIFVARSFTQIARERWVFYTGLAATWLVLGALLAALRVEDQTVLVTGLTPWRYAITQFGVIVHYLRLSFWPHPLVLDYLWPLADGIPAVLPWAIVVLALAGATVWALVHEMWVGFWGAWFFLILAPTSSVVPIADAAFEHRMYLPLVAPVVLVVVGGYELLGYVGRRFSLPDDRLHWAGAALVIAVVTALGYATIRRNEDYRSDVAMWSDVSAKRPGNPRAHQSLGAALFGQGRTGEAMVHFEEAVRLKPDYADAHTNVGVVLLMQNKPDEAERHFSEAVRLKPDSAEAHSNLAAVLLQRGLVTEAVAHASKAASLKRDVPETRYTLGRALAAQGDTAAAIAHFSRAVELRPDYAEAHSELGSALVKQGRAQEAIPHFAQSVRLKPGSAQMQSALGSALYNQGRIEEAIAHYSAAIRLDPGLAEAHHNLGLALLEQGDVQGAIARLSEAVRLQPDFIDARNNLRAAEAGQQKGGTRP